MKNLSDSQIDTVPGIPPDAEKIRAHLRRWRERLLDQTGRNPLLRREGSRISALSITTPEADVLFRLLAVEGKSLRLPLVRKDKRVRRKKAKPVLDEATGVALEPDEGEPLRIEPGELVFAAGAAEIARKLRRIRDNARTSLEERGVTTLHLALGALHFRDARLGGECAAPLWLVPCKLEGHGPERPLTLAPCDEDPRLNPSLELYLRERHKLVLPPAPDEPSLDAFQHVLHTVWDEAAERGWRVEPEAWLSTFSFESLVLWRDLDAMENEALAHPVVRSFARASGAAQPIAKLPEDLDTLSIPGQAPLPVLETDSSQLEALTLAANGEHLVVHGPPGTGKSQTIANLIADAIGRGKRVLFVSAKMAALEVVHRRLVEQGLADFCLEAHSARGGKTKIAGDLRRSLENAAVQPGGPLDAKLDELEGVRDRLNRYVRALHAKRGALDRSVYEAIGAAEERRFAPDLRFALPWSDALAVTAAELDEAGDALDELAACSDLFDGRHCHPWRGYTLPTDPQVEQNLDSLLETLVASGAILSDVVVPIRELDGIARDVAALDLAQAHLSTCVCAPAADVVRVFSRCRQETTFWETLSAAHRAWMREVKAMLVPGTPATSESLGAILATAEEVVSLEGRLKEESLRLAAVGGSLRPNGADVLSAMRPNGGVFRTLRPVLSMIAAIFLDGFDAGEPVSRMTPARLVQRATELLDAREKRGPFTRLLVAKRRAERLGLAPLLEALEARSVRNARAALERRFHFAWAAAAIRSDESLAGFQGERQELLAERFREVDASARRAALRGIREVASRNAASVREASGDLAGESAILRRELSKRRAIKPLRRLFAEAPNALQALKPCMLMSPVSVSTWLPPGSVTFDLVVFDEASQIPTPQAVPAILRAAQTVVAGDPKQLPPSTFFDATPEEREDGDDGDDVEPLESLLDECVACVPSFREAHLRWHYRSQDERLIQFSNHMFYEDRLITFPSTAVWSGDRGVRMVHVPDGVWDRGRTRRNANEAKRAAEIVVDLLREDPGRSVGVIAMNIGQKEAIEDALAERLEQFPDVRKLLSAESSEPFFVKSLENVQGDERDAIVVSLGYGRDPSGTLSLNFGPLNNDGGWRRLNVLITRAKRQTVVVSSLRASDLSGVNASNRGATALREYLAYAERGGELAGGVVDVAAEPDSFAHAVKTALEDRGYVVDANVGIGGCRIELGVRHPDDESRYLLGVECDGAAFAAERTARDRDLLRRVALEGKGWRLHRVWSADWFRDRDATLDRLLRALLRARASTRPALTVVAQPEAS